MNARKKTSAPDARKNGPLHHFAHSGASKYTEDADIRAALAWFVECVQDGQHVNPGVMKFIADGVQRHLDGRKPWAAKRGIKKKSASQAIEDAFPMYEYFTRIMLDAAMRGKQAVRNGVAVTVLPLDRDQAISDVAEHFSVHDETVKRAIRLIKEGRRTEPGLLGGLETFFAWLQCADGRRWLKSKVGREFQELTKYIATLPHEKVNL